jgi:apolipoprotein D and lipocalin family protein
VTLSRLTAALALTVAVGLGACATSIPASQVRAPQPTKPIDLERFYSGQWLEVARLPMRITDGCVAATTDYVIVSPTRVDLRDACRQGGIDGRERAVGAAGVILDPGFNAKLRAPYFGGLLTWEYWVLDRADDYSWFISADPKFEKLWIYTRTPPSPAQLSALVERARALGYDVSRLEFPETAP